MFSALKKLAKGGDDRCPAPTPMSSSLQKKFSRGVHYNMKILIKGDRNVGKSCLLQRLQGGPFVEEYTPTDQIQVAPIHWTYKNSDHIVKVEVWEVVDKGRTKKKPPLGLKLENQSAPSSLDDSTDTPVLDATFLDVYKNASGVILMLDITKPWTFDYVVKELNSVPADIPVVVLGNHCDMQHHRQVHSHHVDQAIHQAKLTRTAPVRYAESSMRNGFGLRLLHKFLSVPFLRLQRTSLLEQLQRNQKDNEELERELDEFQNSEESHYNSFLDRLANKRKQNACQPELRPNLDRSPSIVLGGGKPIVPPNVNPLVSQSLSSLGNTYVPVEQTKQQTHYVSAELLKPKQQVSTTSVQPSLESGLATPPNNKNIVTSSGMLDEFYAGALDNSFLDDLAPLANNNQGSNYNSDSDDGNILNPMVTVEQDDLEVDNSSVIQLKPKLELHKVTSETLPLPVEDLDEDSISDGFVSRLALRQDDLNIECHLESDDHMGMGNYPLWARDSSIRRSPEGGEDPDATSEKKTEKKQKKKKSKDKDREKGELLLKSEKKERKHKHKKSKSEKSESRDHPQSSLLQPASVTEFSYDDYDSL